MLGEKKCRQYHQLCGVYFCVNSNIKVKSEGVIVESKKLRSVSLIFRYICKTVKVVAPKCLSKGEEKSCFMFMFRSKRSTLTKRLWKARIRRGGGIGNDGSGGGCCEPGSDAGSGTPMESTACEEASVRGDVLKKLTDNQLEMLLAAVEGRGTGPSHCVLVPAAAGSPHVRCCQTWRWPDLRHASELKRAPACASINDPVYTCCNPYHWSRLCEPESPPPPYCRFAMDRLKPEDRAPSEGFQDFRRLFPGSLTTNGEDSEMNGSREWCKLAYWELATRVGRLFPVELPAVNVFSAQPHGDGLCLSTLAQHSFSPPPESVRRTRAKIGLGVTLSQEPDGVWVYNRSESPIFVNSPTLDDVESRTLLVYRVPPGHCLCIFDPVKAANCNFGWDFATSQGPVDRNSVRISFAKGWGPKYSRQEVTACPCWLEVLLAPCR